MNMDLDLDMYICNKCFAPTYRGKHPYYITQCGHIFCQKCLQQVENQCPQCQQVGPKSIPLREPLAPKVTPFFVPLEETLGILLKVDLFRKNQMKSTMQRFHELDKKYEMLKKQYCILGRNLKLLTQKYLNLKSMKEKLDKKMLVSKIHENFSPSIFSSVSSKMTLMTPTSDTFPSTSTGYSSGSGTMRCSDISSMLSIDSNHDRMNDGFRIPSNRRPPRSIGSFISNSRSNGRI
ncbi:hypothetical protein DMN91_011287 [Ooceraea biroi]|uniref:RING-type domain-containing protein n=1 Tax=Ooceraea biroi TaxID=2015173 RepID=A0A3L8DBD9_OOCBI|nr:RING finger protein 212B [Ooceraea biroi]RLU17218.1 hypothetical protein DMN91_011287 [Ooceraea biroi]